MGAPNPQALVKLLDLFESRYAMRVLWALQDGRARTFRTLQAEIPGITPNTLNTRIKELREAGLMTHDTEGYVVTALGLEVTRRLSDIQPVASKWLDALSRKVPLSPAA